MRTALRASERASIPCVPSMVEPSAVAAKRNNLPAKSWAADAPRLRPFPSRRPSSSTARKSYTEGNSVRQRALFQQDGIQKEIKHALRDEGIAAGRRLRRWLLQPHDGVGRHDRLL